jgi:hypothetical protein
MARNKRAQLAAMLDDEWLAPSLGKNPSLTPRNVARPLGLIRHGALVSVIGSHLSIRLQHSLNNAIRAQAVRGKVTKRWWHTSRVRIPNDAMTDICLVRMFLALEGHSRVWTRPIGLLIPRSPTITPISDACYGGLGGWAQGHPLIWRLNKADLEACGFILPTGREPSEAEKKEVDFDHINILEFVAVIVNIGVAVRYLMLQPRRTAHVIMNVLSDNTSALSWMKHAARTKKKTCSSTGTFSPGPSHILSTSHSCTGQPHQGRRKLSGGSVVTILTRPTLGARYRANLPNARSIQSLPSPARAAVQACALAQIRRRRDDVRERNDKTVDFRAQVITSWLASLDFDDESL